MSDAIVNLKIKIAYDNLSEYHHILSLLAKAVEAENAEVISIDQANATYKPCGHSGNCRCFHGGGEITRGPNNSFE